MLSLLIFLPLIGAVLIALLPRPSASLLRVVALVFSLAAFVASLVVLFGFNTAQGGYQWAESADWIKTYGIGYKLGVDGISIWLVMLTTVIFPIAILSSAEAIHDQHKEYYALIL